MVSRGRVLGVILEFVGGLGDTSFVRVLERGLKFDDFPGAPDKKDEQVGGQKLILGPRTPTKSRLPSSCLEILRLLVQMT